MTQAKVGGELGINGEWYEGGQFLPNYETTIKGAVKATILMGTKKEVAPYVWQAAPADDMLSIYDRVGKFCNDNRKDSQFVKGEGFSNFALISLHSEGPWNHIGEDGKLHGDKFSSEWISFATNLMNRFNNGERWFPLSEDPFHYKNQS